MVDFRTVRAIHNPRRLSFLDAGEAALRRGDFLTAQEAFERAASLLHAADSEMGLVRTAMQAGRYREALAFCTHTAGAHRESVAPSALYALLLVVSGQGDFARQVLAQALERAPKDTLLLQAHALVEADFGVPSPVLLQPPHRMAPQAVMVGGQAVPPNGSSVRSGAVLLADGRHALAPLRAVQGARAMWVRDGLGRTVGARVQRSDASAGMALRALEAGLPAPKVDYATAPPRAGRPGYAAAQATQTGSATPAWPWLFRGFIGRVAARDGKQSLGIELPAQANGVLVMDADGRVAGVGVRMVGREVTLQSVSHWNDFLPSAMVRRQPTSTTLGATPLDKVYERALQAVLQVVALR